MNGYLKKTARAVGGVAFLAGVAAGYVTIYQQSQTVSVEQRSALERDQRAILHLESELKQHALEARFGRVNHYDDLVEVANALEGTAADWSGGLVGLLGPKDVELAAELDALGRLMAAQRVHIEDFKSHNSILKNSLRYMPMAIEDLQRLSSDTSKLDAVGVHANAIMFETYKYSSFAAKHTSRRSSESWMA